jgi:PncC family amidohydrolase
MNLSSIVALMKEKRIRLVTAESCTAGLIASRVADIPGAGALLDCAFVTYSGWAKQRCLSVNPETIRLHNLTSEAVAVEMALGALQRSRANLAISNTGVTDATDPKIPPGTQCFAWVLKVGADETYADKRNGCHIVSETRQFSGERNQVRHAAAEYALVRIPRVLEAAELAALQR